MTKLDDLRDFVRNKNKKKNNSDFTKENLVKEKEFSLEVAGSEATTNPLALH